MSSRRVACATSFSRQVRAAAALDEVELGIDLVGAVDGDVEVAGELVGEHRDPERLRLEPGRGRRGERDDVAQLAGLEQRPEVARSPIEMAGYYSTLQKLRLLRTSLRA